MADLVQQQTAILQQAAVLVGLHPTDLQFITQTESDLWTTYEARLTQKLGPAAITKIKENPDPLDRILSLIDEVRKSLIPDSAGNLALDNVVANIKILEENRTKERLERETEAKAKSGEELYQKRLDLLKELSQNHPAMEKSLPDIAPSLTLEPQRTLERLSAIIPPEDLAILVPTISDPVVEYLDILATKIVPGQIAHTFTIYKIANPKATTAQVQQLIERITLSAEASGKPVSISEEEISSLSKVSFPSEGNLGILSLTNQFLKAGYPIDQSSQLAKQFTSNFVPIVNTISSFTPHKDGETPQQYSSKQNVVKIFFSNQIIDYLGLQNTYFVNPAQYYGGQQVPQPFHPNQEQSGALNFIFNLGKDKFTNKISSVALEKFAASELGKKVVAGGTKAVAGTAAKTGLAAGITSVLTALGIADPELISKAILAALAVVSMFGKQIWNGTKKIFKNLTLVAAAGGAAVAGAVPVTLAGFSRGLTGFSSAMVGLVATEIATPVIVIALSLPIVIALLLFIINSSAYVVPYSSISLSSLLAQSECTGDLFQKFIPSPVPQPHPKGVNQFGLTILPRLTLQVSKIYGTAEKATGVPCEILAGIHWIEASNRPDGSLVSGRPIGGPEPDVGFCDNQRGVPGKPFALPGGGCGFASLLDTAIYAGSHLKGKVGGNLSNYQSAITALSRYNGGGNANCQLPYKANDGKTYKLSYSSCPRLFEGEDDPYATNWLDSRHDKMSLIFCADHTRCPPRPFLRDGSFTVALNYHLAIKNAQNSPTTSQP